MLAHLRHPREGGDLRWWLGAELNADPRFRGGDERERDRPPSGG